MAGLRRRSLPPACRRRTPRRPRLFRGVACPACRRRLARSSFRRRRARGPCTTRRTGRSSSAARRPRKTRAPAAWTRASSCPSRAQAPPLVPRAMTTAWATATLVRLFSLTATLATWPLPCRRGCACARRRQLADTNYAGRTAATAARIWRPRHQLAKTVYAGRAAATAVPARSLSQLRP